MKTTVSLDNIDLDLSTIPQDLIEMDQWVVWKEMDGAKKPFNPSGDLADPTNPVTAGSFQEVKEILPLYDGLGFVITDTSFTGIDFDACRNPETGRLTEKGRTIVNDLNSYAEISPSGTGIHILLRDSQKPGERCKDGEIDGLEVYEEDRFLTVTGNRLAGTPQHINSRPDAVEKLYREAFPEEQETASVDLDELPVLDLTDDEVIDKAGEVHGEKFEKLFHRADLSDIPRKADDETPDYSRADFSLVNILSYFTGADEDQIDRLFRQSALHGIRPDRSKPKWNSENYRKRTIREALTDKEPDDFYGKGTASDKTPDLLHELTEQLPLIDWPNPRTSGTDRDVYEALLRTAIETGKTTISASCRELSEMAGVSTKTASNARNRLNDYGLVDRQKTSTRNNADYFSLQSIPENLLPTTEETPEQLTHTTTKGENTVVGVCVGTSGISTNDEAFHSQALGKKAKEILETLLMNEGEIESISEVAERAGTTARTVRKKVKSLEEIEVVETEKEGRRKKVTVTEDWKDHLENYRKYCPTNGRNLEKKIDHKVEQMLWERNEWDELRVIRTNNKNRKAPKLFKQYLQKVTRLKQDPDNEDLLEDIRDIQEKFDGRVRELAKETTELIYRQAKREAERLSVL